MAMKVVTGIEDTEAGVEKDTDALETDLTKGGGKPLLKEGIERILPKDQGETHQRETGGIGGEKVQRETRKEKNKRELIMKRNSNFKDCLKQGLLRHR